MTMELENKLSTAKCEFWLANKGRFCKFDAIPGKTYCGNHFFLASPKHDDGVEGYQRVPCPADPKHTVLVSDLENHLKKCPSALLAAKEKAQPHFQPDVNAGSDEEPDIIIAPQPSPPGCTLPQSPANPAPASTSTDGVLRAAAAVGDAAQASNPMCSPFARGRAAARAAYARSLGQQGFMDLVAKLQAVYDEEVGTCGPALRVLQPPCVSHLMTPPSDARPFNVKHAAQQASILGHMLESGLLPLGPPQPSCSSSQGILVELGAGKAGLAGMACAMVHPSATPSHGTNQGEDTPHQAPLPAAHQSSAVPATAAAAAVGSNNGTSPQINKGEGKCANSSGDVVQPPPTSRAQPQPKPGHQQEQQGPPGLHQNSSAEDAASKGPGKKQKQKQGAKGAKTGPGDWVRPLVGDQPVGCGAGLAVLVDNRGAFQAKADRHMRELIDIERITIDLKDLALWKAQAMVTGASTGPRPQAPLQPAPAARPLQPAPEAPAVAGQGTAASVVHGSVASREGVQASSHTASGGASVRRWAATGKHLCGAATDFSLRCCLSHHDLRDVPGHAQAAVQQGAEGTAAAEAAAVPGVGTLLKDEQPGAPQDEKAVLHGFQGLAFATCCHHRCGWRAYVGKAAWRSWGLTPEQFEVVSWMTGWALCGHDAAPGLGGLEGEEQGNEGGAGAAAAGSVHGAGKGKSRRDVGSSGGGPRKKAHAGPASDGGHAPGATVACSAQGAGEEASGVDGGGEQGVTDEEVPASVVAGGQGSAAAPSSSPACMDAVWHPESEGAAVVYQDGQWDPARALPRAQRMAIGAMCKALIDRGRLLWCCSRLGLAPPPSQQNEAVEGDCRACLVAYVQQEVSGENKLLLVRV